MRIIEPYVEVERFDPVMFRMHRKEDTKWD